MGAFRIKKMKGGATAGILLGVLACSILSPRVQAASTSAYHRVMIVHDTNSATSARINVNFLRNAVGHFRTITTYKPVEDYVAGDTEQYDYTFYLGSAFKSTGDLPEAFLYDVAETSRNVVWIHNNIWLLLNSTNEVDHLGLDFESRELEYDRVRYKGEELRRDTDEKLVILTATNPAVVYATAFASTNGLLQEVPYAIASSNFWYFAGNPFKDTDPLDRSLVFHDLLHDVFESSAPTNHRAIVRIEDVDPGNSKEDRILEVAQVLNAHGVRGVYAIVPRYLDERTNPPPRDVRISENREYARNLRIAERLGQDVLMHGYTHQRPGQKTGSGWEFWDDDLKQPLPYDTEEWARGRVDAGMDEMALTGFPPLVWETPHYGQSLLDTHVFASRYRFHFQRMVVFNAFTDDLTMGEITTLSNSDPSYSLQVLPSVTHQSIYDCKFIPENLSYYDPGGYDSNGLERNISNKVVYARQLKVVRDAVATFYFHLNFGTNTAPALSNLIQEIKDVGYTFTDMDTVLGEGPVE